jgi:ribosomal protein L2
LLNPSGPNRPATITLKLLSQGLIFCRGPRHLTGVATRGTARPDRTTLWGRRATHHRRPRRAPRVVTRVSRVWSRSGRAGWVVGPAGLIHAGPVRSRPGTHEVTSFGPTRVAIGVTLPLRWIPVGTRVSEVAWAGRAAGAALQILRHRSGRAQLRLPSRRSIWVDDGSLAVVGAVPGRGRSRSWRAGDTYHRGGRPRVRGVAMNPVDHPHGGGQGKTSGGRPGVTPWGRLTRGVPTRRLVRG